MACLGASCLKLLAHEAVVTVLIVPNQFLSTKLLPLLLPGNYDWECSMLTMKQLRNRETTKVPILYFLRGIVNPTRSEISCSYSPQMQGRKSDVKEFLKLTSLHQSEHIHMMF